MKRIATAATVVAVVAAVGAAVAWRFGLIGPGKRTDDFDESEVRFFDDYGSQSDSEMDPDVEAFGDTDLKDDVEVEEAFETLEVPDYVPDALSDSEVPDAELAAEELAMAEAEATRPTGSHEPLEDGSQPEGFPIKGNANSNLYHEPGSLNYERTRAEVWFATAEDAEAAGFSKPKSPKKPE